MRRAVAIWGCPHLVHADNGKVYVSRQRGRICAELGVALAHAAPYHPQSKGKIERYWASLAATFDTFGPFDAGRAQLVVAVDC